MATMITKIGINLPGIRLEKLRLLLRRALSLLEGDLFGVGHGGSEWE